MCQWTSIWRLKFAVCCLPQFSCTLFPEIGSQNQNTLTVSSRLDGQKAPVSSCLCLHSLRLLVCDIMSGFSVDVGEQNSGFHAYVVWWFEWDIPYCLRGLNIWLSVDGTVWGALGGVALLVEGAGFDNLNACCISTSFSLLGFVVQDVNSRYSVSAGLLHSIMDSNPLEP